MVKATLSHAAVEKLVKHLLEIEESKNKLFQDYFPETSKERNELEKLIENYIKQIEQLIKNVEKTETAADFLPFVTIGSEVEVQDQEDGDILRLRLVSPFQKNIGKSDISYLSPAGKSLLLKKVGDEIKVEAPAGIFRYQIKSIHLREDMSR